MDLVGRVVTRKFRGSGIFKGVIESHDTSTGIFKIAYEDGDSEELDLVEANSLVQSVPEKEKVMKKPGRKPKKRRRIRDDPGKGNSVDNNHLQSTEDSAAEIGLSRSLNDGLIANGDAQQNSCFRASIDLNLSAVSDIDEGHGVGELDGEVEKKERAFDLNLMFDEEILELETEQAEHLVDVPIEMVESKNFSSLGIVEKVDVESVCFNVALNDNVAAQHVAGDSFLGSVGGGEDEKASVPGNTSDLTDAGNVNSNTSNFHLKEGYQEVGTQVLCEDATHVRRKRRKLISTLYSPEEGSLRRSARRAKATAFAQNNDSSNEVIHGTNDISSSGISVVSEEKPDLPDSEGVEESEVLPPPVALPPSSRNLNLDGIPVLDLFSVYACLRSFSALLYLSPFTLEDFVASLKSNIASTLLDAVHVAILQTLRKHLKLMSGDGSEPASTCLRNLNWDLLDEITWPIFLAEYLLIHGSEPKPCYSIGSLNLVNDDYYKQPAGVKIAILQCLCDDVIEVDCIQAELNRRISASDFGMDVSINSATFRKTRASSGSTENALLDESVAADTTDWNSDECCLCKMEGNLICCDGCPAAYHSRCVGVVSSLLPEGEWYCPECVNNGRNLEIRPQKLIRGAELLGADPYGRIYFHCCDYLLVSESYDPESSFSYYHKDDFSTVINALESSGYPFGSITRAISKHFMSHAVNDQQKNCLGSPSVFIQAVCKPAEHSMLSNGEEGNERKSETLGNPVTGSEGTAEVLQVCEPSQICDRTVDKVASASDLSSVHVAVDKTGIGAPRRKRGRPPGSHRKSTATKGEGAEAPPVHDDTPYVNNYSFAQIASTIAEEITHKPSDKINEPFLKSEEEIMSTQLKTISKKSVKFCWPSFQNIHAEMRKEKCGWCYSCKSPDEDGACLFNVNTNSSISEGLKAELDIFQSKHNKRGHLGDLICCILFMEHRLRGLLQGHYPRSDDSQFFLRNVLKEPDFALVKHRLLWLESNLRPSALSADWVKHVDSPLTMGSASHVVIRTRVSSRSRLGRKRNMFGGCDPTPINANGGLVMFWWRGGQLSRKLFNWKVLPRSLALKAARKGGSMKIPGLLYPDSSEYVKRSKQIAWRAAVEMSTSVAQLALQVRELDLKTRWDEIENTYVLSTLDKESQKSIKLFKKVVVRRKCVEGTMVKYLLDFGKRRLIPDVVQRYGSKVDDPTSDRKKYWLEESYLPLHLLRNFEEKTIARKAGKVASSKAHCGNKVLNKPVNRKGLDYLIARAEKSNYYLCGHCKKDVLIRDAVSCKLCQGYFHKRHVRKPSAAIAKKCIYTCYKCESGKRTKVMKRKGKVKLQKIKSKNGTGSGSLTGKVKSKRGRKPKVEHRQMLLRNNKRFQVSDHPTQASPKANVYAGVTLRRSARKAKSAPVHYDDVARGGKPEKQSISQNEGNDMNFLKEPLCKKRAARPLSTLWKNGLHLSRKPDDERAAEFKTRKLLIPTKCSAEIADQPKCILCGEEGYTAGSKYISCEICGGWYHGDAFDLDTEIIKSLIGFRCHVCLNRSAPVCPYLEEPRSCEPLPVQAANDAGTESAPSLIEVALNPNEPNLA